MIARLFLRLRIGMTSVALLGCVLPIAACNGGGGGDDATDADGDGFGASSDCNDDDASIHPYADEHCNAIDDDCDGDVDEGVLLTFYVDADHDTYGSDADVVEACSQIPGAADNRYDCDDSDPEVNPDATEVCANGTDEDCDGEDLEAYTWYADADGDGYGDPATTAEDCDAPTGFIADSSDCDDGDAAVHPGVDELCDNAIDDDCDKVVASNADVDADGWYADACVGGFDCDDGDSAIRPDAYELCEDKIDSDCDGMKDDCTVPIFLLSDADAEFTGVAADDAAGSAVAIAGDVNGDGVDDILVGAPNAGAAYLLLGEASLGSASLSDADATYTSSIAGDGAGWSVAGAGNVNGDEYDDIIIGAPYDDAAGVDAGVAYVVLGSASPTSLSLSDYADAEYEGEYEGDVAGYSVAAAGNVDGDEYDDLLVGAYMNAAGGVEAGAVYLVLGSKSLTSPLSLTDADAVFTGTGLVAAGQGDHAGISVAGAGDVDGDGVDDLLVGADFEDHIFGGDIGRAYVLFGPPSATVSLATGADITYTGAASGDIAGHSVAAAGDVDDDGTSDVLVGVPGSPKVNLQLGASGSGMGGGVTYTGETSWDSAGSSVAGAGDVNGDDFDDFLVGAPDDVGAVYLVLGSAAPAPESLLYVDRKYIGAAAGDGVGWSVGGASVALRSVKGGSVEGTGGDVDDDGYDDFLVGAWTNDDGGTDAGAAYLIRGGL